MITRGVFAIRSGPTIVTDRRLPVGRGTRADGSPFSQVGEDMVLGFWVGVGLYGRFGMRAYFTCMVEGTDFELSF